MYSNINEEELLTQEAIGWNKCMGGIRQSPAKALSYVSPGSFFRPYKSSGEAICHAFSPMTGPLIFTLIPVALGIAAAVNAAVSIVCLGLGAVKSVLNKEGAKTNFDDGLGALGCSVALGVGSLLSIPLAAVGAVAVAVVNLLKFLTSMVATIIYPNENNPIHSAAPSL